MNGVVVLIFDGCYNWFIEMTEIVMKFSSLALGLILTSAVLIGCSDKVDIVRTEEFRNVKVLTMKPPKRFKISVEDERGRVFEYGSKRCSEYSNYQVGNTVSMKFVVTKWKDKETGQEKMNEEIYPC